jgi:hypothetical protein
MCCSSGVCGPDGVDELAQFASTLDWLKQNGVSVSRFNLGHQPEAFAGNPMIRGVIASDGIACLPLVVSDGKILSKGRYPRREELASNLGLTVTTADASQPTAKRCCG